MEDNQIHTQTRSYSRRAHQLRRHHSYLQQCATIFWFWGGALNQKKTPVQLEILGGGGVIFLWEHGTTCIIKIKIISLARHHFFIDERKSTQVQILVTFFGDFREQIQKFLVGNSVGPQRTELRIGKRTGEQHTQLARCGILGFGFSLFPTLLIFSTSSHKFSPKWAATFHHTWSTRATFKRENHHWKGKAATLRRCTVYIWRWYRFWWTIKVLSELNKLSIQ